jgi:hypothetical protein
MAKEEKPLRVGQRKARVFLRNQRQQKMLAEEGRNNSTQHYDLARYVSPCRRVQVNVSMAKTRE